MQEMAMFPLGSVLFPTMVLPLHVFEPRYRELVEVCLAGEPEFGVTLIERGSEVGGGDIRAMTGTVARILEAARFDDGRWALGCVGTRRVRVVEWLPDAPYPRAIVEAWDDDPDPAAAPALAPLARSVRRALALRAELGEAAAPATLELSDDVVLASFQLAAIGPFGPADRQRLLEAPTVTERLELLRVLAADELEVLALRVEMDGVLLDEAGDDGPGPGAPGDDDGTDEPPDAAGNPDPGDGPP